MTILAMIGPQHQNDIQRDYWEWILSGDGIAIVDVNSDGTYWHQLDAVNGAGDVYGWWINTASNPDHVLIMFQFDYGAAPVTDAITLFQLASGIAGTNSRRLVLNPNETMQIQCEVPHTLGSSATLSANTTYNVLWYIDARARGHDKDMLWVSTGAFGTADIDVDNHGDYTVANHDLLSMGEMASKTLPTSGGPCNITQGAVIDLGTGTHRSPYGSMKVVLKMPTGNGTDTSFNDGPTFGDIDEVPYNRTDFDKATSAVTRASYTLPSVDGSDDPLAVLPIGVVTQINTNGAMVGKPYVWQGSGTRDGAQGYAFSVNPRGVSKQPGGIIEKPTDEDGWTRPLFNSLEVGYEATTVATNDELELSQLGVLYCTPGSVALPDDYPRSMADQPVTHRPMMQHLLAR